MEIDLQNADDVTTFKYNLLTRILHKEGKALEMEDREICNFLLSCAVGILARGFVYDDSDLDDDMEKMKTAILHIKDTILAERKAKKDEV